MDEVRPSFEAKYVREYGAHEFYALDGTPIWAISEPSWPRFLETFANLPKTGGYILSPELITGPDKMADIPTSRQLIEDDIECAKQMSIEQPNAHLFLGSATFDNPFSNKARNSLLILHRGKEVGRVDQRYIAAGLGEKKIFEADLTQSPAALPKLGHAAIVCSDILVPSLLCDDAKGFLDTDTTTLIVASKWGISGAINSIEYLYSDDSFRNPLENYASRFFNKSVFPNLSEVIIVDKADNETGLKPFNVHYKRTQ